MTRSCLVVAVVLLSLCQLQHGSSFAPAAHSWTAASWRRPEDRIVMMEAFNPSSSTTQASALVEDSPQITSTTNLATDSHTKTEKKPTTTTTAKNTKSAPQKKARRTMDVSAAVDLPFSRELAYDCFADLPRQPEWSPWLHSVEWMSDDDKASTTGPTTASKWTLKVAGFRYSWVSVATQQERPSTMAWESTSGLKNYGQVNFVPNNDSATGCRMTMTMTFVPPRLVAAIFGNSRALKRYMEQTMVGSSLERFRDVVIDTTLGNNATMLLLPM